MFQFLLLMLKNKTASPLNESLLSEIEVHLLSLREEMKISLEGLRKIMKIVWSVFWLQTVHLIRGFEHYYQIKLISDLHKGGRKMLNFNVI